MAYEFKKLSDVNILEEKKTGLNVLVEDAGEIVKISNDDLNPYNFYMVVDTTYHYGKENGSINPYFQEPISTIVNKFQQAFNKTVLARGILSSSGMTTYDSIGNEIIRQADGTFDAIIYYNDLHPLYLSSSKNTITLLEGWEETAPSIPAPATAEVGQVIAVKAVDENGKPTEWEAVDGGSGDATSKEFDEIKKLTASTRLIENEVCIHPRAEYNIVDTDIRLNCTLSMRMYGIYRVIYDGIEYYVKAMPKYKGSGSPCLGDDDGTFNKSRYPFRVDDYYLAPSITGLHSLEIYECSAFSIDPEFIPVEQRRIVLRNTNSMMILVGGSVGVSVDAATNIEGATPEEIMNQLYISSEADRYHVMPLLYDDFKFHTPVQVRFNSDEYGKCVIMAFITYSEAINKAYYSIIRYSMDGKLRVDHTHTLSFV